MNAMGKTNAEPQATTFAVWYMRPEFLRDGLMGLAWLRERGRIPDPALLSLTHVHLTDVVLPGGPAQLEAVFHDMQGEVWSPNGEAREMIRAAGLHHTSMSVGDIAVVDGRAWIVDSFGFADLDEVRR